MSKHCLFICKSCNTTHSEETDYENCEGASLFKEVLTLNQKQSHTNALVIQSVRCLWTCEHPCAIAFSATNKPTYLFTQVSISAASALLQFGDRYVHSKTGDIPWKSFPDILQSASVAKIPPVSIVKSTVQIGTNNED
jgi:predicted metal-binding protein